jgi:hypothetical protein
VAVVWVEGAVSSWMDGRIVTDNRVVVREGLLAAEPGNRWTIRTLGGEVDGVVQQVLGEPWLHVGSLYLVFLEAMRAPEALGRPCLYRPVGMAQGALPVRSGARGVEVTPVPELSDLATLRAPASVAAWLVASRPLAEVTAEVRAALRRGRD